MIELDHALVALHFKIDNGIFVKRAPGHAATDTKTGFAMVVKLECILLEQFEMLDSR